MARYKFVTTEVVTIQADCLTFTAEDNFVSPDGLVSIYGNTVRVQPGYAWDGCSPCINVLDLFYIKTPDGVTHLGKPITYHASLLHDILCQYRHSLLITKAESVMLFKEQLRKVDFKWTWPYALAVKWFGPQDWMARA